MIPWWCGILPSMMELHSSASILKQSGYQILCYTTSKYWVEQVFFYWTFIMVSSKSNTIVVTPWARVLNAFSRSAFCFIIGAWQEVVSVGFLLFFISFYLYFGCSFNSACFSVLGQSLEVGWREPKLSSTIMVWSPSMLLQSSKVAVKCMSPTIRLTNNTANSNLAPGLTT